MSRLGPYLREIRTLARLKLREVESASGVSNAYLSQLETGKILKPSPDILRKLADAYGHPYERLMEVAGYHGAGMGRGESSTVFLGSRILISDLTDLSLAEEDSVIDYLAFLRSKRPLRNDTAPA